MLRSAAAQGPAASGSRREGDHQLRREQERSVFAQMLNQDEALKSRQQLATQLPNFIQVLYINNRIRVKLSSKDTCASFLHKVSRLRLTRQVGKFFNLSEKPGFELGLLQRLEEKNYSFLSSL